LANDTDMIDPAHSDKAPLVGVVMGSRSDWDTMQRAAQMLDMLGVPHEVRVVSAHRTPDLLFDYAHSAASRGLRAIIAGAGGAASAAIASIARTANRRPSSDNCGDSRSAGVYSTRCSKTLAA